MAGVRAVPDAASAARSWPVQGALAIAQNKLSPVVCQPYREYTKCRRVSHSVL